MVSTKRIAPTRRSRRRTRTTLLHDEPPENDSGRAEDPPGRVPRFVVAEAQPAPPWGPPLPFQPSSGSAASVPEPSNGIAAPIGSEPSNGGHGFSNGT